jgi:hypothetical protein
VLRTEAGISTALRPRQLPVPKFDSLKSIVLFGQEINQFHVSHPQETKGPLARHEVRQDLCLCSALGVSLFFVAKHRAFCGGATLQQRLMKRESLLEREYVSG